MDPQKGYPERIGEYGQGQQIGPRVLDERRLHSEGSDAGVATGTSLGREPRAIIRRGDEPRPPRSNPPRADIGHTGVFGITTGRVQPHVGRRYARSWGLSRIGR